MGGFRQRNKKKRMNKEQREQHDIKMKKIKQENDEKYLKKQQENGGYRLVGFQYRNVLLEGYYKRIFEQYGMEDNEFDRFLQTCKQRLAVTFRVNKSVSNYENLWNMIERFRNENQEDIKQIEWFGEGLIYQLNQNRQQLKREKETSILRDLIIQANESGMISRQELVSMLSPICLNIQNHDLVLDMCAAPGSKTGQLLETIGWSGTGGVVANDADLQRSNMLIHQIQRNCNSCGILIVNHLGQQIPAQQQMYDKVLCDVPCSGDGAIRKIPNKWKFWSYKDGMGLHGLQVQILIRGLQVLKKDGLLLYSTCSLSPIEDEAVITEVFRRMESKSDIELVDIHDQFRTFRSRKGLVRWPVMRQKSSYCKKQQYEDQKENDRKIDGMIDKMYDTFWNYEEYKQFRQNNRDEKNTSIVKESMFSESDQFMNEVVQIEKTMRVLPHDQNTGGFYLALFRKKGEVKINNLRQKKDYEQDVEEEYSKNQTILKNQSNIEQDMKQKRQEKREKQNDKQDDKEQQNYDKQEQKEQKEQKNAVPWIEVEESVWSWIKQYYGFKDDYIKTRLYQEQEGQKRIVLVSEKIKGLLKMDFRKNLNIVNMGSKAFYQNRDNYGKSNCPYRLCQDSIMQLYPHFENRKIRITLDTLKEILNTSHSTFQYQQIDQIQPQLSEQLQKYKNGTVILYWESDNQKQQLDMLVAQNFTNSVCLMISKETYQGMRIKYCCNKVTDYQKVEIKTIYKNEKEGQQDQKQE